MGQSNCTLVGLVGILIQLSLGALSFSVLLIKRWRQKPKRPWKIWILDTSKQVISQLFAHFINLTISIALSYESQDSDACIWYFITNIMDNTFGVLVCVLFLKLIHKILKRQGKKQYISGNYHRKELQVVSKHILKKQSIFSNVQNQNAKHQTLNEEDINKNKIMKRQRRSSQMSSYSNKNDQIPVQIEMQQVQNHHDNDNKNDIANSKADNNLENAFKDFKDFTFDQQNSHKDTMLDKNTKIINQKDDNKSIIQQPIQSKHEDGQKNQQIHTKIIIDYKAWIIQLLIWNAIVTVTKSAIFGIQFGLRGPLMTAGTFLMGWVQVYPILQLLLVIVIVPVIMNGLAFWIQDNFLMKKTSQAQQQNLLSDSHKQGQKQQENVEEIIVDQKLQMD